MRALKLFLKVVVNGVLKSTLILFRNVKCDSSYRSLKFGDRGLTLEQEVHGRWRSACFKMATD